MKETRLGFLTLMLCAGFAACNNDGDGTATTDSATMTTTDNTATTTMTSTDDYTALSDTFRVNNEAGNYLDASTGKAIRLRIDTATGLRMNEATNKPVWRYVDKRDYKVYYGDSGPKMWDTVGTARMQGSRLEYRDSMGKWVNYDKRWKMEDDQINEGYNYKEPNSMMRDSTQQ